MMFAALLAGCGSSRSGGGSGDVFAWVPAEALTVRLVDWESVNEALDVGRSRPVEDHVHALLNTRLGRVVPSTLYGYDTVLNDLFGWDLRDLAWEVHWTGLEHSATVIRFAHGIDMGNVEKSFERNGYQSSASPSRQVLSRPSATAVGPLPFRSVVVYRPSRVVVLSVDSSTSLRPGVDTWDKSGWADRVRSALQGSLVASITRLTRCDGPPPLMPARLAPTFDQMRRADFSVLTFRVSGGRLRAAVTNVYPAEVDAHGQARAIEAVVRIGGSMGSNRPSWAYFKVSATVIRGQTVRFELESLDRWLNSAYTSSGWPFTLCAGR
jgi:hypothetical protein